MKILMVLTSHDQLGDTSQKTGFWLEEFASPYYVFKDALADITLASPLGGKPPIDPKSEAADFQTEATQRFNKDTAGQELLANTLKLSDIVAEDYDALFYPGGHGPLWDLVDDVDSIALIETMYASRKAVAAVCHAPSVLLKAKAVNGSSLVKGKSVTGFSNSEEEAVQLTDIVPFLLENELIAKGANYSKSDDWQPYIIADGHLITGQNPASSESVAKALLAYKAAK
ncbi:type 1 glutamine amidotransferase domain-containing protein [methanotrophic endosymbiont of Bathymodiolus puteoserpentis (Logatchev)]|jgi:putative intracellular protease/amidase|uniref:type 1 glutamine amidotransferase domain-containing protein n=1 Tax=methanotrophic endosymbiont of Bathymodiolus puteoserpentis (Logatchev) TaxID=343235 RepID=UPI0013CD916C|nr:type 1 glutamine amidotransferase domain-containing protein [methanotrophic endosymbiont of Bathymodiolus puteoserpentis (Logatchev)]SHE21965.1 ThiJ/PfpI family protein [methanotrophic endosymbiont of Bathymodiolus puteoserpentis (Logatchev)]